MRNQVSIYISGSWPNRNVGGPAQSRVESSSKQSSFEATKRSSPRSLETHHHPQSIRTNSRFTRPFHDWETININIMTSFPLRKLGKNGPEVSAIGTFALPTYPTTFCLMGKSLTTRVHRLWRHGYVHPSIHQYFFLLAPLPPPPFMHYGYIPLLIKI